MFVLCILQRQLATLVARAEVRQPILQLTGFLLVYKWWHKELKPRQHKNIYMYMCDYICIYKCQLYSNTGLVFVGLDPRRCTLSAVTYMSFNLKPGLEWVF